VLLIACINILEGIASERIIIGSYVSILVSILNS
jgi:hypothetical protein